MSIRQLKPTNLLGKIRDCIDKGNYLDTSHFLNRSTQRLISRPEVLYVLKNGWHEKSKDKYDKHYQNWNFAIRGQTIDKREIRVIVSFDEEDLLIITAIALYE